MSDESFTSPRPDASPVTASTISTFERRLGRALTGEWIIDLTTARQRRIVHYWLTILWFTAGLAIWIVFRQALWFVGLMSLYAIWITHLAGWAAETPVEPEEELPEDQGSPGD